MRKKYRVKKNEEFQAIMGRRKFYRSSSFIVYIKEKSLEISRIGISVPKKTGKAHIRNKIKRRIKNIIDINEFNVHKSYDYVIIIRKRLIELNYKEIEENLLSLINRIGAQDEKK